MSKILKKNTLLSLLILFFTGFSFNQQSYAGGPDVEDLTGEINTVSNNIKYIKTGICPTTTGQIPCAPGSNFDKFIDDVAKDVDTLGKHYRKQRDEFISCTPSTPANDLTMCDKALAIRNRELTECDDRLHGWANLAKDRRSEIDRIEPELGRYQLFSSSFLSGAAYSVLPEIVRDLLDSRGYSVASNIGATLVQGGLIAYNTASYVPIVTGFAVKTGFKNLNFSEETSTTAASTAAVLASVVPALVFSQETAVDCVVNCSISMVGSYAGSTLALRAKSWIYDKWESYNRNSNEALLVKHITKLEKEVKNLKEDRKTLYSLTSK